MKKIHTGVTVWCIFNIGMGLISFILAIVAELNDTFLFILVFLEIIFYGLALIPNSFAIISIFIINIISLFLYAGDNGTWGYLLDLLFIFLNILFFFVLKYNGQSAFKVSRNINTSTNNTSTKKCPFCANEIKKEAIVCQFCNRDLPNE